MAMKQWHVNVILKIMNSNQSKFQDHINQVHGEGDGGCAGGGGSVYLGKGL